MMIIASLKWKGKEIKDERKQWKETWAVSPFYFLLLWDALTHSAIRIVKTKKKNQMKPNRARHSWRKEFSASWEISFERYRSRGSIKIVHFSSLFSLLSITTIDSENILVFNRCNCPHAPRLIIWTSNERAANKISGALVRYRKDLFCPSLNVLIKIL